MAKSAHFLPHCNGLIYVSPQVVTEQESKLAEQNKLISDLQGAVSELEAEALTSRYQIHRQQRAQEEMQSQAETLQHTELQTRVALECLTSRVNTASFTSDSYLPGKRCFNHFKQSESLETFPGRSTAGGSLGH